MDIFIICSVRGSNYNYRKKLEKYTQLLENKGHKVYLPHRDTDQNKRGIDICSQNMEAIKKSDEVHIFYSSKSLGTHFDLGVTFALNKKIKIIENEFFDPEIKSFAQMITDLEKRRKNE